MRSTGGGFDPIETSMGIADNSIDLILPQAVNHTLRVNAKRPHCQRPVGDQRQGRQLPSSRLLAAAGDPQIAISWAGTSIKRFGSAAFHARRRACRQPSWVPSGPAPWATKARLLEAGTQSPAETRVIRDRWRAVATADWAVAAFGLPADPVVAGPRAELYLVWAMNFPNTLTLLRIFFVPLLVAALVQENVMFTIAGYTVTKEWLALSIFLTAAATDLLDGYLARRWSQVTTIGTLLDPIADKLLISAALISLVQVRVLPGWMAILIVAREFAVSGLRSIAAAEGYTIKASDLGKTKMLSQVVAVSCMLLSIRHRALRLPGMILMWGVVFFAVLSAVSYFRKFWRKVDESVKKRRRRELLQLERKRQRALLRQRKGSSASAPETL